MDKMTLGELETKLALLNPSAILPEGFGRPNSWRGVYSEVAFEPVENAKVADMLFWVAQAQDEVFHGWKGGDYTYDANTPANIQFCGCWEDEKDHLTRERWRDMVKRAYLVK